MELWTEEWRRPQAVMWELNGQELEVAMYVRSLRRAEQPSAPVNARTLVRQQMDSLGISLPGMQRLGWRIVDQPVKATRRTSSGSKDRLQVIQGGG